MTLNRNSKLWPKVEEACKRRWPNSQGYLDRCKTQKDRVSVVAFRVSQHRYPHRYTLAHGVSVSDYWFSLEDAAEALGA